jgi:microsomal epoxide hydrolase
MAALFTKFPSASATIRPKPFKVAIPDSKLEELKYLLKYSKLAPNTYESSQEDRKYGITSHWIQEAKDTWENNFDW